MGMIQKLTIITTLAFRARVRLGQRYSVFARWTIIIVIIERRAVVPISICGKIGSQSIFENILDAVDAGHRGNFLMPR